MGLITSTLVVVCVAVAGSAGRANAQTTTPRSEVSLTLADAVTQALARNRDIIVSRRDVDIGRGRLQQARRYPFNPELGIEGEGGRAVGREEPDHRRIGTGKIGLSQIVEIKGQRGHRISSTMTRRVTSSHRLAYTSFGCLALVGLGILSAVALAQTFDSSRYQPSTLEAIVGQYPGRRGISINPDRPFRARVTYTGRFRSLAQDARRLIEAWSAAMAGADVAGAFRRELNVEQPGQQYWLAVQEMLVPQMEGELRAGEAIDLFVIYIGQIDARHILLIDAFARPPRRPPTMTQIAS